MFPCGPYTALTILSGEAEDVVAQHHKWNHAPRLPNNEWLLAIWDQQNSQVSSSASHTDDAADAINNLESPPLDSIPHTPANQASNNIDSSHMPLGTTSASGIMPDNNSDPSQLQHYTPPVCDIIERVKQISHCDIASVNSFPLCADFNCKAVEYINEAIVEHCLQGLLIPQGMWHSPTCIGTDIIAHKGWWPWYTSGITKLVSIRLITDFASNEVSALGRSQQLVFCT